MTVVALFAAPTPVHARAPRAAPRRVCERSASVPRPTTTMRVGVARLDAQGKREKETQRVAGVVEEQPTGEGRLAQMREWGTAHPLQMLGIVVLATSLLRRVVRRGGAAPKETRVAKKSTGSAKGGLGPGRAVPRRHESTEEALDLLGNKSRKYILVGGKGGVGKTSMSAAVATAFADQGQTTLIVSTDPAHSLSDAFGQKLSGGDPVPVMGIDGLYAQEVNPDEVKRTFKMGGGMGNAGMDELGLGDLDGLFETIPPGFDEAVALVEIVKYIQGDVMYEKFERIVFDTAPTGHTLRLLALPDFLNGFFGKMISMKSKLGGVMRQFKGMFGAGEEDLEAGVQDMEEMKKSMQMVRDLFRDALMTEFVVATIPNMMAIAESKRLLDELTKEGIPVRHLFVNQMQPQNDDCTFCSARYREHTSNLKYIKTQFEDLKISTVQVFDKEIRGGAALRAMGKQLFPEQHDMEHTNDQDDLMMEKKVEKTEMAKAELVE